MLAVKPTLVELVVSTALHAGAAASAHVLARPRFSPYYKPVAYLLSASLVTEAIRWVNREVVLAASPHRPLEGWFRVAGHVEQALALAWPAAVVAVVLWAFRSCRSPWPRRALAAVVAAHLFTLGWLVTHYPAIRQARLERFYRNVHIAEVLIGVGVLIAFYVRARQEPQWPQMPQRAALAILIAEVVLFVGPFAWGNSLFQDADLAIPIYSALYLVLILLQWRSVCRIRTTGQTIG